MLETSLKALNPLPRTMCLFTSKESYWHLEKLQKHGNNQQENQYNKKFRKWFVDFVEGDGCFYITKDKPICQYIYI